MGAPRQPGGKFLVRDREFLGADKSSRITSREIGRGYGEIGQGYGEIASYLCNLSTFQNDKFILKMLK